MIKSVGKILFICLILLSASCQNNRVEVVEYKIDFLEEYTDEIKLLLGEVIVVNKDRVSETFYGTNLTQNIVYDVWKIEYKNVNQEINYTVFKNRYDFTSSLDDIIYDEMIEDVINELGLDSLVMINFENGFDGYEKLEDIDPRYYPVNLKLNDLPDELLIVISPREDKVKEFNEALVDVIEEINRVQIKNVLLLYGDDAYQMDHGKLVIDGVVVQEKISVEDSLKWIESNRVNPK